MVDISLDLPQVITPDDQFVKTDVHRQTLLPRAGLVYSVVKLHAADKIKQNSHNTHTHTHTHTHT